MLGFAALYPAYKGRAYWRGGEYFHSLAALPIDPANMTKPPMAKKKEPFDLAKHLAERLTKQSAKAPFLLRITQWQGAPVPVLVVKERQYRDQDEGAPGPDGQRRRARPVLIERGNLCGEPLHRCLPLLRRIVEGVADPAGVPLELARYLTAEGMRIRGNLPLDEEAGAKLALIFRLQDRIKDLDRVELIARRVRQFTREEAAYWLSRTVSFGTIANRWALSGLRTMLGGHTDDKGVAEMLERLRLAA